MVVVLERVEHEVAGFDDAVLQIGIRVCRIECAIGGCSGSGSVCVGCETRLILFCCQEANRIWMRMLVGLNGWNVRLGKLGMGELFTLLKFSVPDLYA